CAPYSLGWDRNRHARPGNADHWLQHRHRRGLPGGRPHPGRHRRGRLALGRRPADYRRPGHRLRCPPPRRSWHPSGPCGPGGTDRGQNGARRITQPLAKRSEPAVKAGGHAGGSTGLTAGRVPVRSELPDDPCEPGWLVEGDERVTVGYLGQLSLREEFGEAPTVLGWHHAVLAGPDHQGRVV